MSTLTPFQARLKKQDLQAKLISLKSQTAAIEQELELLSDIENEEKELALAQSDLEAARAPKRSVLRIVKNGDPIPPGATRLVIKRATPSPAPAGGTQKIVLAPKKGNELIFNPDGTIAAPPSVALAAKALEQMRRHREGQGYLQ